MELLLIALLIIMAMFILWFLSKHYTPVRYWLFILGFLLYAFISLNLFNDIKGYPVHEKTFDNLALVVYSIKTEDMLYYWVWLKDSDQPRALSYKRTEARDKEFAEVQTRIKADQKVFVKWKNRGENDDDDGTFMFKKQSEVMPK